MHNKGLGQAGEVRSVKIEGGMARLIARIGPHASTVVTKIKHNVLPFIEIIHDGAGEVLDCSLVDRPEASDGIMKLGRIVIAKLYQKEGDEMKTQREIEKAAVQYALGHKMTGTAPEVDRAVWSLLYKAQRPVGQISSAPVTSSLGLMTGRAVR
jgi:hypothetical protein